ncbi:unnamed protein product [Ceutorhynchus assimilis]|uniref:DUF243 domain-containing protein n=1 Tax=Ceutorhynchus assimilis TaxID=467358 RepID=A0A9N9QQR4_9CUCU|nr:unnamed protein product [Ceutorhynchus assimilis]
MINRCISIICLFSLILNAQARPEPPSPYTYLPPSINQNNVWAQNQQQQQVPINSYGTPVLTTSNQVSNIAPNRNYGSPDLIYSNQSPAGALTTLPSPSLGTVQKHIYVHVAPPDVDEERIQRLQQAASAQKHYKIIFIKTPTYLTQAEYAQQQQQSLQQEKTLIYVLVKKPDDPLEVRANQIAQQASINKPEVYFIKYKSKVQKSVADSGDNNDNDSVVVDNSLIGNNVQSQNQGYQYNRPREILK